MGKRGRNPAEIVKCKRCGLCCIVATPQGWADCKYLVRYIQPDHSRIGGSFCMIYQHRLYAIVGAKQFCHYRDKLIFNFPSCPYNKEGLEMHPKYKSL